MISFASDTTIVIYVLLFEESQVTSTHYSNYLNEDVTSDDLSFLSPSHVSQNKNVETPDPSMSFNVETFSFSLNTIDENLTLAPRPRRRSRITAILIPLPIRQHVSNPWTIREFVDLLEIFLGEVEWLSGHVGNVFPD